VSKLLTFTTAIHVSKLSFVQYNYWRSSFTDVSSFINKNIQTEVRRDSWQRVQWIDWRTTMTKPQHTTVEVQRILGPAKLVLKQTAPSTSRMSDEKTDRQTLRYCPSTTSTYPVASLGRAGEDHGPPGWHHPGGHRRSKDFVWGALFFPEKVDDLF